ncbi:MAG: class I SAM-dependent methyltransferase [Solirubrobacteraceae bacterium]|nr:class I SAM-dependent methyltransferase [Solirubrobacteraceae bacterium]
MTSTTSPTTTDSTTIPQPSPDALKAQHRATWADGDYDVIARTITGPPISEALAAAGPVGGQRVLDVATGTGNLAIELARRGAEVDGLDLVPELLAVARERADAEGFDIAWAAGDAEALPYADGSFDLVTSVFGVQFAPRAEVVGAELRRVVRPGGAIVLVNWTPEGLIGRLFKTLGAYLPAPPSYVTAPPRWGTEALMGELFADDEVRVARATNRFEAASPEAFLELFTVNYGPVKRAKERTEAEGSWPALRDDLLALYDRMNAATDGTLAIESEFAVATIRRK